MELVVEGVGRDLLREIEAARLELLVAQGLRTRDELAVHGASGPALACAVLDADDLLREPEGGKPGWDAAVVGDLAVVVGRTFPRADGGEVRRLQRRDLPLVDRVIRDPGEADLAVRPR